MLCLKPLEATRILKLLGRSQLRQAHCLALKEQILQMLPGVRCDWLPLGQQSKSNSIWEIWHPQPVCTLKTAQLGKRFRRA